MVCVSDILLSSLVIVGLGGFDLLQNRLQFAQQSGVRIGERESGLSVGQRFVPRVLRLVKCDHHDHAAEFGAVAGVAVQQLLVDCEHRTGLVQVAPCFDLTHAEIPLEHSDVFNVLLATDNRIAELDHVFEFSFHVQAFDQRELGSEP